MTTLSKEDVVRWAREAELTVGQHWNRGNMTTAFMTDFATLARADIVEANKALVAENERLKAEMNLVELALPEDYSESKDWKFDKSPIARIEWLKIWHRYNKSRIADLEAFVDKQDAAISEKTDQLTATRTALAAAEADNERLRKALDKILTTDWVSDRVRSTAKTALAQPRDDSALREMIAGVYEECKNTVDSAIKEYANSGWHGSKGYHMGLLKASEVAIRALAEKAKGG